MGEKGQSGCSRPPHTPVSQLPFAPGGPQQKCPLWEEQAEQVGRVGPLLCPPAVPLSVTESGQRARGGGAEMGSTRPQPSLHPCPRWVPWPLPVLLADTTRPSCRCPPSARQLDSGLQASLSLRQGDWGGRGTSPHRPSGGSGLASHSPHISHSPGEQTRLLPQPPRNPGGPEEESSSLRPPRRIWA